MKIQFCTNESLGVFWVQMLRFQSFQKAIIGKLLKSSYRISYGNLIVNSMNYHRDIMYTLYIQSITN